MSIRENLNLLKNQIPKHVALVAVSKTKPLEDILRLIILVIEYLERIKFKRWLTSFIVFPMT